MKKLKLHIIAVAAVLATAISGPASAVTWSGEGGWEVSYTGFINLFYNQLDFEYENGNSENSALLNEGLLPSFHTMKAKSPEVNGLTGTSQITFAVDTSTDKGTNLNKGDADTLIDLREVFFNVDGSFGTLSVGRTLALYQRQAILKDMTLFGTGGFADPDSNGTALGRIGIGYVYPDFRARFAWTSNEVNGMQVSFGVFQPRETGADGTNIIELETDIPQFQGEFTYNTSFEGGTFGLWGGFQWQEATVLDGVATGDVETAGWNVGVDVGMAGLNLVGSYYGGSGLGTLFTQSSVGCTAAGGCGEADNTGGYVQLTYAFQEGTKVGGSWGYSEQEAEPQYGLDRVVNEGWTVGVYHDVNPWLKLIAEYNDYELEALSLREVSGISLGAFMFW